MAGVESVVLIWLDRTPRPGWMQMALDRALLDLVSNGEPALLRLYFWDQATISFGANESALRHWDRQAITDQGIATVRRPTGGRAVWHDPSDLTYSVVTAVSGVSEARKLYRSIHEKLLAALGGTNHQGHLAPRPSSPPDLGVGSCFDSAAGGEILIDARKTVGSAQLIHDRALLQHGEIARATRHHQLSRFARRTSPPQLPPTDTPLPSAETLAEAIASLWLSEGAQPVDQAAVDYWLMDSLRWQERFQDPAWTWRR